MKDRGDVDKAEKPSANNGAGADLPGARIVKATGTTAARRWPGIAYAVRARTSHKWIGWIVR